MPSPINPQNQIPQNMAGIGLNTSNNQQNPNATQNEMKHITQTISNKFKLCNVLSTDYKNKHRELIEVYYVLVKLLSVWKNSKKQLDLFGDILANSDIGISEEELERMRCAQKTVMRDVEEITKEVDDKFYSEENPLYKELTTDEKKKWDYAKTTGTVDDFDKILKEVSIRLGLSFKNDDDILSDENVKSLIISYVDNNGNDIYFDDATLKSNLASKFDTNDYTTLKAYRILMNEIVLDGKGAKIFSNLSMNYFTFPIDDIEIKDTLDIHQIDRQIRLFGDNLKDGSLENIINVFKNLQHPQPQPLPQTSPQQPQPPSQPPVIQPSLNEQIKNIPIMDGLNIDGIINLYNKLHDVKITQENFVIYISLLSDVLDVIYTDKQQMYKKIFGCLFVKMNVQDTDQLIIGYVLKYLLNVEHGPIVSFNNVLVFLENLKTFISAVSNNYFTQSTILNILNLYITNINNLNGSNTKYNTFLEQILSYKNTNPEVNLVDIIYVPTLDNMIDITRLLDLYVKYNIVYNTLSKKCNKEEVKKYFDNLHLNNGTISLPPECHSNITNTDPLFNDMFTNVNSIQNRGKPVKQMLMDLLSTTCYNPRLLGATLRFIELFCNNKDNIKKFIENKLMYFYYFSNNQLVFIPQPLPQLPQPGGGRTRKKIDSLMYKTKKALKKKNVKIGRLVISKRTKPKRIW